MPSMHYLICFQVRVTKRELKLTLRRRR